VIEEVSTTMPTDEPDWIPLDAYLRTFGSDARVEQFERWGPWFSRKHARVGDLAVTHVRGAGNAEELPRLIDGRSIASGYRVLLLVRGGALVCGEYVEAPGLLVFPPNVHEGAELIEGAEAIFVALGPKGEHNSMSRLFVPLQDLGITIKPQAIVGSMVERPDQTHAIPSLGQRRELRALVQSFARAKPGHDFSHQHYSGGELLLVLDGQVVDGRRTIPPMTLCVNGPLTTHEPRPLTDMAALTLALGV
jgi:hypothetical protein